MRSALGLAAMLLGVGCSGSDGSGTGDRVDDILALEGDPVAGADVYAANCALCHGEDGTGSTDFPDITGESDASALAAQVLEGGDGMSAYDGLLQDQEIADVVAYVLESL